MSVKVPDEIERAEGEERGFLANLYDSPGEETSRLGYAARAGVAAPGRYIGRYTAVGVIRY